MNFAMGLQAVDEYFREGDRRKTREYQQALRDSELSLLPDKTESSRSTYRDSAEVNAARARLRPGQTELSLAQNQSAQDRQPDEAAAAASKAKTGASEAKFTLDQLPVTQQTKQAQNLGAASEADFANSQLPVTQQTRQNQNLGAASEAAFANTQRPVTETTRALANSAGLDAARTTAAVAGQNRDLIPQTLAKMQTQGVLSAAEQTDAVLSTLARRLRSNDEAGSLAFANQIAKIPNILPSLNGKVFTSIQAIANGTDSRGKTGPGYAFVTEGNEQIFITSKTMVDAYTRTLGKPKFDFLHDKDTGEVIRTDERTGEAQVVRNAQPGRVRGGDKMPSDQKMIQFYMDNGMDFANASKKVSTQKEPGRTAFISKRLEMKPNPTEADIAEASRLYDMSSGGSKPAAPSNSAAPGTVDPRFNSLLGIK